MRRDIPSGSVTEDSVPQQAEANPAAAPSPLGTAKQRRDEIVRILNDFILAALSDQEIAQRVGTSPSTVANIRRRLATKAKAEEEARRKNEARKAIRAKIAACKAPRPEDAPVIEGEAIYEPHG